jgi:hypothetical protein
MYNLQEEIHDKIDSSRPNFFWHGHGPNLKHKYRMGSWELMATPKGVEEQGLLTQERNKCLLSKRIFKIERGDDRLCRNPLRKKYLWDKVLLLAIREIHLSLGMIYRV